MADLVHGRLAPQDALLVLDAVERDRDLSVDLDLHVELLNLAKSDAGAEFRDLPVASQEVTEWRRGRWWEILGGRRVLVPAGILLGVVLAGFALISIISRAANPYGDLADLGDPTASFRTRGGSDADLVDASTRYMDGDASEAAERFERYLRMYPSSEWVPWVEYAAGLSRLSGARRTVLGIGSWYDSGEVQRGVEHLDRILGKTAVPELMEDALWYRAKGSLMLGDAGSAEANLARVITLQGSRQPAAQKLLSDLRSRHH